jgi:hypothetical protein
MKSAQVFSIVLAVSMFLVSGCKARETTSNTVARATPSPVSNANAPGNSNRAVQLADSNRNADAGRNSAAPDSEKAKAAPQLIGTYESREVHTEGVVTVMSKLRTVWRFYEDGNYARISMVNGKTYHTDSGAFRIEPPDKLLLTIQITGQKANRKIHAPALQKTHKFSLSPDGDELRLTSDKGAVGIFQRVSKQNPS